MAETNVIDIPLDLVKPGFNFRKRFDQAGMDELTESIRKVGVLQPVLVMAAPDEWGHYILVSGERRYRAAVAAGLETIPAVLRDVSPKHAWEIALIENLHRRDLTAIEEAQAYKALVEECGLKQEEVAERVGVSQSQVSNRLRLLRLPPRAQELIEDGTLAAGHGLALLKYLPDGRAYEPFFSRLLEEYVSELPPVNRADEELEGLAGVHSRSLEPLQGPYYGSYSGQNFALFDPAGCAGCPAAIKVRSYWGGDKGVNRCINLSCYEAKQAIAQGEIEAKARADRGVTPGPEPRETPEERRQREEEAKEREREREEKVQKRIEKVAKKAAPAIPEADTTEARRLRDLAALYWERAAYVFERECYCELAQIISHWKERLEIGASQMPSQMGMGSLLIPGQGITVEQSPYSRPDGVNISLDPLTLHWGTATIVDTAPTSPVYYRCGLVDSGSSKSLHQVLVVPCETRDVIMESTSTVIMRRDLVPKLAALLVALPAFPGVEDEAPQEPEARADMSEPAIPEAFAEDAEDDGDDEPESDEAFDEEMAPEDADRTCPIDDKPVTDEACSECLQWDETKGCTYNAAAVPPPEAAPPEAPRPEAPASGGIRVCPKTGEITGDDECEKSGCADWDAREEACFRGPEKAKAPEEPGIRFCRMRNAKVPVSYCYDCDDLNTEAGKDEDPCLYPETSEQQGEEKGEVA